jgi:hypothetical protein
LAGIAPEKLANVAIATNAEPKVQAFALNVSMDFLPGMLPARSLDYLVNGLSQVSGPDGQPPKAQIQSIKS